MVREIFRNLVTAEGTRAARERAELLSVFGGTGGGGGRADALVDARLLTEYDAPDGPEGSRATRRIEIVHESLLTHWPRLVRWRTQDADGAQLATSSGRPRTSGTRMGGRTTCSGPGTSYLDYRAWRARYSGGLSALEEASRRAMTALANRRRRRRRMAVAAVVAVAVGWSRRRPSLWSRSETARRKADAEALRAEASKLLALGQTELERYPTAALAYSIKSLELADTR